MNRGMIAKKTPVLNASAAILLMLGIFQPRLAAVVPGNLKCGDRLNPVGMDLANPQLSWILFSDQRGEKQTAYQILAASSLDRPAADRGDLWDSRKVISDATARITFAGKTLVPHQPCHWKMRAWY